MAAIPALSRRKNYKLRERFQVYTQRMLATELATALRISREDAEKILSIQRIILWERICQYDRTETQVGLVYLKQTSKGAGIAVDVDEELVMKAKLLASQLEE